MTEDATPRRLRLNSLLLAYETHALKLYDLQREDLDPEDYLGVDRDATIAKTREALERVRAELLALVEGD